MSTVIPVERLWELFDLDLFAGTLISKKTGRPLSAQNQNDTGYVVVCINCKGITRRLKMHQCIWAWCTGAWPTDPWTVDHEDRNHKNNRITNLRLATPRGQNLNRGVAKLSEEPSEYRYPFLERQRRRNSRPPLGRWREESGSFEWIVEVGSDAKDSEPLVRLGSDQSGHQFVWLLNDCFYLLSTVIGEMDEVSHRLVR